MAEWNHGFICSVCLALPTDNNPSIEAPFEALTNNYIYLPPHHLKHSNSRPVMSELWSILNSVCPRPPIARLVGSYYRAVHSNRDGWLRSIAAGGGCMLISPKDVDDDEVGE